MSQSESQQDAADNSIRMTDEEVLAAYLRSHDVPCPHCGRSLRGGVSGRCPACGRPHQLKVAVRCMARELSPQAVGLLRNFILLGAASILLIIALLELFPEAIKNPWNMWSIAAIGLVPGIYMIIRPLFWKNNPDIFR